ncbi:MAG: permease-like cell division protein FtsX [Oscillospiraceae bacterium]|nr:permease-like cell division protein FtsX [Oscillospiraceae bacterium]MCL2278608.1 permease-like cell division protein FtsX [Oscillospiraceae bacterium]
MKVNRNKTFYFIREGVSSIFTHGLMSFASVCIIIAFLVIMGSFILLAVNITALVGELEAENIILAYVHENLSVSEASALEHSLRAIPNVANVNFITREEAMERFIGRSADDAARFRDIDAATFRHRFEVFVEDVALIGETQHDLRHVPQIASVNAHLAIAQGLVTVRNIVTWASIIIVAILLAISLFIMSNTIKLATFERREEIAIMKMVGATNSFIRWPFIFEGFLLGVTGAMAAFFAVWGLYSIAFDRVIDFEAGLFQLVSFSSDIAIPVFLLFAGIGFGVGVGGSGLALNRYLKV